MSQEELDNQGGSQDTETQARERGWVPKEEWTGEEGDWVSSKEFMERANLYDAISSANHKIKNLEKANQNLNKHYENIKSGLQEQHQKEIKELRSQLDTAAEEGDKKKVGELHDRIVEQSASMEQESGKATTAEEVDNHHQEWLKDNPWYGVNDEKTNYAKLIATGLLNQHANPNTQELDVPVSHIYEKLDEEMAARFGEEEEEESGEESDGASTNKPKHTAVSNKSKRGGGIKKNKADMMTEEQKKMCASLVSQGVMTKAQYVKDLEEAGYLGEA